MNGIKDWIFSRIVSPMLLRSVSGSESFFNEQPLHEEFISQGFLQLTAQTESADEGSCKSQYYCKDDSNFDPLDKIEGLQIRYLRLVRRLGQSHESFVVAKVLYRLHIATLILMANSNSQRVSLKSDRARTIAVEEEAIGLPEFEFSMRILVLGKTGIGKSATINSIFDQTKVKTDAFRPATEKIQEVAGTLNGIKITFIDTPGLLPSCINNLRRNREILLSVKRFIGTSPPDIVLYFERLDVVNMDYGDIPLLKLITNVFGSAIWLNTIPVMTHSSLDDIPTGINGYELYVSQRTNLIQHFIHEAMSDSRLEHPMLLVENHHECRTNIKGEKILPDGRVWKSHFLLLCTSAKILNDANTLMTFKDSFYFGKRNTPHIPSLPHLLSSFLKRRPLTSSSVVGHEIDEVLPLETEDEYDYDQLPSIRMLTKSEFEKLTKSQTMDYLNELDYRETLYLRKQLKEVFQKSREKKHSNEGITVNDDVSDNNQGSSLVADSLPDITPPLSFYSDFTVHRYRSMATTDQWLVRPIIIPRGWDHDAGFDGINLRAETEIKNNIFGLVTGHVSKDKKVFNVQSECIAAYSNLGGHACCVGVDVQSAHNDLICTVHGSTKLRMLRHTATDCGVCVTCFGDKYLFGGKIENSVLVGRRLKFVMNAGGMASDEKIACSGNLKATLRGRDYPVRNDSLGLTMTVISFSKEMVLSGSFETKFQLGRSSRMSVEANLNSLRMGKFCIKISSTKQIEVAVIALVSFFTAQFLRKGNKYLRETVQSL